MNVYAGFGLIWLIHNYYVTPGILRYLKQKRGH